jgi:hypothetical protein
MTRDFTFNLRKASVLLDLMAHPARLRVLELIACQYLMNNIIRWSETCHRPPSLTTRRKSHPDCRYTPGLHLLMSSAVFQPVVGGNGC